jgi:hypothetical protein
MATYRRLYKPRTGKLTPERALLVSRRFAEARTFPAYACAYACACAFTCAYVRASACHI